MGSWQLAVGCCLIAGRQPSSHPATSCAKHKCSLADTPLPAAPHRSTATAAIESALMIAHNSSTAPDLSEQQLLSCVAGPGYSSRGCDGGSASEAINYVYNSNLTVEARCGSLGLF